MRADGPPYGYWPSFGWIIAGITGFTLTTLLHVGQVIFYAVRRRKLARALVAKEAGAESFGSEHVVSRQPKYWFIFATLITGGTLEMVGWWGRWWSSLEHSSEAEVSIVHVSMRGDLPGCAAFPDANDRVGGIRRGV